MYVHSSRPPSSCIPGVLLLYAPQGFPFILSLAVFFLQLIEAQLLKPLGNELADAPEGGGDSSKRKEVRTGTGRALLEVCKYVVWIRSLSFLKAPCAGQKPPRVPVVTEKAVHPLRLEKARANVHSRDLLLGDLFLSVRASQIFVLATCP